MGKCKNYNIECPYALSDSAPVPCIGSQEQCDKVRKITHTKMKAEDWKFDKFLPDHEDVTAVCKAAEAYFELCGADIPHEVSCFHAGFNRGADWMLAKLGLERQNKAKRTQDLPESYTPSELRVEPPWTEKQPQDLMFGIAQQESDHEFGFWNGPNPNLQEMLETVGRDESSVIIRLNPDGFDEIIYRWSESQLWAREKQNENKTS